MSRRSRARRKLARQTYRSSRETPRAIAAKTGGADRGYPRAQDLLENGQGWREFLEATLRTVLRPVAVASVVGLAGCGAQAHTPFGGDVATKPTASQTAGTGAVLVPMPPTGTTGQQVVTGSLPPPVVVHGPPVQQTNVVPPIHRPPPGLQGTPNVVVPIPHSQPVRGEMQAVDPVIVPTTQDVPLGGAPMPVTPDPVQPPPPQPQPSQVQPQPPPPQPQPIAVPGGMAAVTMPSTTRAS